MSSSRILLIFGAALFFMGVGTVVGWKAFGWIAPSRSAETEFPFGDLIDVAVDDQGRIYVADGFYSRVQRYSASGEFERGWFADTAGVFALRTTATGLVEVATARANKLLTYTPDGQLLSDVRGPRLYSTYADDRTKAGPYKVKRGPLPRIVNSQTGRTVIATPLGRRLLAAPFPAMGYSFLGAALIALGEWRRRRGRGTGGKK
jgi:hypothetical protein